MFIITNFLVTLLVVQASRKRATPWSLVLFQCCDAVSQCDEGEGLRLWTYLQPAPHQCIAERFHLLCKAPNIASVTLILKQTSSIIYSLLCCSPPYISWQTSMSLCVCWFKQLILTKICNGLKFAGSACRNEASPKGHQRGVPSLFWSIEWV